MASRRAPSPQSAATVVRTKLAQAVPALRTAAAEVWLRPGLDLRYPTYLRSMHEVIRVSVPLMELAAHRCRLLGPGDPIAGPLRRYLEAHIDEERGHDEWLLDDLATLHAAPADWTAPPSPVVARLVGAQYYWINHHHPVALLGYIVVMEGNAPHARLADRIINVTGVPDAAIRTIRAHADLDAGHTEAVLALLETLTPTPAQVDTVTVSALHTVEVLMALFANIARTPNDADLAPRTGAPTAIKHGGRPR